MKKMMMLFFVITSVMMLILYLRSAFEQMISKKFTFICMNKLCLSQKCAFYHRILCEKMVNCTFAADFNVK